MCRNIAVNYKYVCVFLIYLAKFFAFVVWQQGSQTLETGINALHSSSFVAVGYFAAHSFLGLHVDGSAAASTAATLLFSIESVCARETIFGLIF